MHVQVQVQVHVHVPVGELRAGTGGASICVLIRPCSKRHWGMGVCADTCSRAHGRMLHLRASACLRMHLRASVCLRMHLRAWRGARACACACASARLEECGGEREDIEVQVDPAVALKDVEADQVAHLMRRQAGVS